MLVGLTRSRFSGRALEVTVEAIRQHLKNLISLEGVNQTTTVGQGGAQVFALTETGRKMLEFPPILLERRGKTKQEILNTLSLTQEGLTITELVQQLGLNKHTIRNHLGRRLGRSGLMELKLVRRSRKVGNSKVYVYRLTEEGRRVVDQFKILKKSN